MYTVYRASSNTSCIASPFTRFTYNITHNVVFLGSNDFSGAELELVDFSGAKNIKSINLSGSCLNSVNFQGADLRGVDLSVAKEAKGLFLDSSTKINGQTKHPMYIDIERMIQEAEASLKNQKASKKEAERLLGIFDTLLQKDNVEFFYGKKIESIMSRLEDKLSMSRRLVRRFRKTFK